MVTLPQPINQAAAGWQLVDFLRHTVRTEPAAGSQAAVDLGQLDPDELWLVDRAVVSCDSTTKTSLRLYETTPDPLRLLSGSDLGNFDEADYPTGLQVAPSTSLVAVWSNASDGARGVLRLQGRVMRRA